MLIKSQLEVRLYTGRSVQTLFSLFRGSGSETTLTLTTNNVLLANLCVHRYVCVSIQEEL